VSEKLPKKGQGCTPQHDADAGLHSFRGASAMRNLVENI
jgi:hypothetical protein